MNAPLLRRAALSLLTLLPLLPRAAAAVEFDDLLRSGFQDVRESAARDAAPVPHAQELPPPPFVGGGVFLHSSLDGRLAYCSAAGCRLLLDSGAEVLVSAGPGALYFTGTAGTGYCTARRCDLLLPGVRVIFPLSAGPKGDIYGSDEKAGWHCAPDACRQASSVPLQRSSNYIQGVYKPQGDFVSSSEDGTFWCADGACARIGGGELLFIEDSCSGKAPARAAYAFQGSEIDRCTPAGCRVIGSGEAVDNYVDCSFDEKGRLLLPARGERRGAVPGGMLCSESGVARVKEEIPVGAKKKKPVRSSENTATGEDGAAYRLADHAADPAPGAGSRSRLDAEITRTDAGRSAPLAFDAPVACWQWIDGDGDEDAPMWSGACRVFR